MARISILLFLSLVTFLLHNETEATKFPIGLIVDEKATDIRNSFRDIAQYFASGQNLNTMLDPLTEVIDQDNVLQYIDALCAVLDHGVFSVFGTLSMNSEPLIDEYTSTLQMPLITVSEAFGSKYHQYKIRLLPDVSPALRTILESHLKWKKAYYFYSSKEGLYRYSRIAEKLQLSSLHMDLRIVKVKDPKIAMEKLDQILTKVHYALQSGPDEVKVILDLEPSDNIEVINRMYDLKEKKQSYHFLIGDLETPGMINWNNFSGGGMNVTALRLVKFTPERLNKLGVSSVTANDIKAGFITTRKALTIDAFNVMKTAFTDLQNQNPEIHTKIFQDNNFNRDGSRGISCDADPRIPWVYGKTVTPFLKSVNFEGLSGSIRFDEYGFREAYRLDVIEMKKKKIPLHIATYTSVNESFNMLATAKNVIQNITELGLNRTRIISTHMGKPYVFLKEGRENKKNLTNDDFDGYIVQFVEAVMNQLNLTYKIVPVKDGAYGGRKANGSWDGMVGEIIRGEADLAIADLTINSDRENVIYFSKPFLRLGISIMIKKPKKQEANKYSFVDPLAYEVWMCVGFAYIGVSVVLFLVGRFSPYEWHIDTTGAEATMKNEFSVWNSLWFVFSTLMQQGCEVAPRAISSRIVASVWYLFTLIIISSYTANLAAFLTAARMNSPINSVEDLAKQTAIKYGTLSGGSTEAFFRQSQYTVYKKMWSYMERNPGVNEPGNELGVQRVRDSNGRYAFLIESTNNEYISNREPCDTMKVGANLNSQGYGIGMPLDSDLKSKINIAILQLRESQKLSELEKKWWKQVGNICKEESKDSSATSRLSVDKIEGIFHILAAGMAGGVVIVLLELLFTAKLDAVKSDGSVSFVESLRSHLSLFVSGSSEKSESAAETKSTLSNGEAKISDTSSRSDQQRKARSQFLSVDDVFTPPNSSPVRERRNKLSPPSNKRTKLKNSASANSSAALMDSNNQDRISTGSSIPAPPEQFRGGPSHSVSKPKANGNQTSV